jgi:hypothetical protein
MEEKKEGKINRYIHHLCISAKKPKKSKLRLICNFLGTDAGSKTLKRNPKVDITMGKWQESLIPRQPVVGSSVRDEGDLAALVQAEEVARCTRELFATRGWCLWKCSVLNGGIIVIARDELASGYHDRYPVYTEFELRQLCEGGVSETTIRLVHEAKKLAGAVVISVEEAKIKERVDHGRSF